MQSTPALDHALKNCSTEHVNVFLWKRHYTYTARRPHALRAVAAQVDRTYIYTYTGIDIIIGCGHRVYQLCTAVLVIVTVPNYVLRLRRYGGGGHLTLVVWWY